MRRALKITGGVAALFVIVLGAGLVGVHAASQNAAYCASCHVMQPYSVSMTAPTRLAAVHAQAGVTCQQCHPQTTLQVVSEIASNASGQYQTPLQPIKFETATCLQCHGTYAQLAQRTQNLERNPHDSHQGQLDCRNCHRVHSDSVYYCGQCHGAATMPKVGWVLPAGATP